MSNALEQDLAEWTAHIERLFQKEGPKFAAWCQSLEAPIESFLESVGVPVLTAAGAAVMAVPAGATVGAALDAGLQVLEAQAPAALQAAGRGIASIVLAKALAPMAPAASAPAPGQS